MYKLKPVFSVPIELKNTCNMYKLKNLQERIVYVQNQNKSKNFNDEIQLSNEGDEVLLKKQHEILNTLLQLEFRLSKLSFQSSDAKNNLSIPEMPLVASMARHVVKKDHQKIESKINDGITSLTQDTNDEIQLSNEAVEVLLKKQHEVLNTLMQLEYGLSKLSFQSSDIIQLSNESIEVLLKKQHGVLNTLMQLEFKLSQLNFKSEAKNSLFIPEVPLVSSIPCHVIDKKHHKKIDPEINNGINNLIKTDTVVFADPVSPPYSLLALPIMWPKVSWDISYHVHSSVNNDLKALKTLNFFKNVSSKYSNAVIKVFVIWTHIKPSPKVLRTPTDTLVGEIQLLRLFNYHLATETIIAADQTNSDKVLDLINNIHCSENNQISELFDLINVSNTTLNVENIAVWSLLYKNNNSPPNIVKWIEQMTKMIIS